MSQVGVFPGWREMNRRTQRAPVNPLDKSTIVSIFPFEIVEHKPTLQPGKWTIPAGSFEKPSYTPIGPSSWWKEVDSEQPLLELPVSSILIADSIVKDYCNGLVACNMADCMPGLFMIPGEWDDKKLRNEAIHLLVSAKNKQTKYYEALVTLADVAWAKTNGNPLSVNETMKAAAAALGHQDREWLRAYHAEDMVRCFACGTMKNPKYPVCPACRAIDPTFKGEIKFVP
jgi:hypothetical protein